MTALYPMQLWIFTNPCLRGNLQGKGYAEGRALFVAFFSVTRLRHERVASGLFSGFLSQSRELTSVHHDICSIAKLHLCSLYSVASFPRTRNGVQHSSCTRQLAGCCLKEPVVFMFMHGENLWQCKMRMLISVVKAAAHAQLPVLPAKSASLRPRAQRSKICKGHDLHI